MSNFHGECRSQPRVCKFSFVWNLDNTQRIQGTLLSPVFPCNENSNITWQLEIDATKLQEPATYSEQEEEYHHSNPNHRVFKPVRSGKLPIHLILKSGPEKNLSVTFNISLLDDLRKPYYKKSSGFVEIIKNGKATINVDDSKLRGKYYGLKNPLTFLFEIEAVWEMYTSNVLDVVETFPRENNLKQLSKDFELLLQTSTNTDVVLVTTDKEIAVHKAVLIARSPVFQAMFENEMEETKSNRVMIEDVDTGILEEFVKFIYTGKMPENIKEMATGLLAAADKYCVESLKSFCEEFLVSDLTVSSAIQILQFADKHSANKLKNKTLEFIHIYLSLILKDPEWDSFIRSRPDLAVQLLPISIEKN